MKTNGKSISYPVRRFSRPIIMMGDSDVAQGYIHAADYDAALQAQNSTDYAYRTFCHQGEGNAATWLIRDEIAPICPYPGTAIPRGGWFLNLGKALADLGLKSTILNCAVGSTTFDDYSPTLNPAAYARRLAWIKTRLAMIPDHLDPIVVLDYGLTGVGTGEWGDSMATLMAALRADLGCPAMGVVLIRAPYTFGAYDGYANALIASQNLYASTDSRCSLAYNDGMTYVNDSTLVPGLANGVHFDLIGGAALAVGPDGASVRSVITALLTLL